jgi:ferredoxin-NADP reductase
MSVVSWSMARASAAFDLRLRVVSTYYETPDVLVLDLAAVGADKLGSWAPGAHVELRHANGMTGHYSLCGSVDEGIWRVAVQLEREGRGSSKQTHTLRAGDEVDAFGPINNFPLEPAPRYELIAGGIGITPILAMVRQLSNAGADWHLTYGGRSRASMAFVDELEKFGDRVRIHPQDELGHLPLPEVLGSPRSDTLVYCCGPEPLLKAVEEHCAAWHSGALHVERFAARAEPAAQVSRPCEVFLQQQGTRLSVAAGQSILDAVLEAGIDHPFSCTEGVCGTCETAVLSGQVDHRDSILNDEERRANDTMMICVSRAASDEPLVLDI